MPTQRTANIAHGGPTLLLRAAMAVFLCAGWSMASPLPAASAEPFCEVQLGGKIATVPCGTCDDVLAEPGMAGNVACSNSRPGAPPRSDNGPLTAVDQQYLRDLDAIGIEPSSSPKKLAQTGPTICQDLRDRFHVDFAPLPDRKRDVASEVRRGNPTITWADAQAWVQVAVNNFCPGIVLQ